MSGARPSRAAAHQASERLAALFNGAGDHGGVLDDADAIMTDGSDDEPAAPLKLSLIHI